ncbi:hypothetical protein ACIA8R_43580 [Nonomuraea sp. NPDC051191]|uniref:hypothetical protein n=1 Tax=Nonomuraea sp. NPDC051191 TaxID=3364372 RepID=UPI0037B0A6A9
MALRGPHLRAGADDEAPRDKVEQAATAWVAARRHDVVYHGKAVKGRGDEDQEEQKMRSGDAGEGIDRAGA